MPPRNSNALEYESLGQPQQRMYLLPQRAASTIDDKVTDSPTQEPDSWLSWIGVSALALGADYVAGLTFYERWGKNSFDDAAVCVFGAAMLYGTYRAFRKTYEAFRD